jgi:hypothetical protein
LFCCHSSGDGSHYFHWLEELVCQPHDPLGVNLFPEMSCVQWPAVFKNSGAISKFWALGGWHGAKHYTKDPQILDATVHNLFAPGDLVAENCTSLHIYECVRNVLHTVGGTQHNIHTMNLVLAKTSVKSLL